MTTDRNPTFAEALLALAIAERNWHNGAAIGDAWEAGVTDAAKFVSGPSLMTYAPPSIRRALGMDGDKTPDMDPPLCHACCKERVMRLDGVLMYGLSVTDFAKLRNKADKRGCKPMELLSRLESDLAAARKALDARDATAMIAQAHREKAAAVARAEKAEAQAAEARAAKADVMAANLRARTAQDERDALRAELDTAKAEIETWKNVVRRRSIDDFNIINLHERSEREWSDIGNVMAQHDIKNASHLNERLYVRSLAEHDSVERERDALKAELDKKRGEVAAINVNGRFYGKDDIRELIEAFESAAAGCGSLAAKLALAEKQRDFSAYLHTDIAAKLAAAIRATPPPLPSKETR